MPTTALPFIDGRLPPKRCHLPADTTVEEWPCRPPTQTALYHRLAIHARPSPPCTVSLEAENPTCLARQTNSSVRQAEERPRRQSSKKASRASSRQLAGLQKSAAGPHPRKLTCAPAEPGRAVTIEATPTQARVFTSLAPTVAPPDSHRRALPLRYARASTRGRTRHRRRCLCPWTGTTSRARSWRTCTTQRTRRRGAARTGRSTRPASWPWCKSCAWRDVRLCPASTTAPVTPCQTPSRWSRPPPSSS